MCVCVLDVSFLSTAVDCGALTNPANGQVANIATTFEKAESTNSLPFAVAFHVGAYFCMGASKRDVVIVI